MTNRVSKSIVLPKSAIREKEGIVILPLKKWKIIEQQLEDLEMYRSEGLAREIEKRRKAKKTIPLKSLLKKYHI
ncbi:hypothetical protein J7J12_01285 [bacterium]|nr:hypothetical protein [bacterium]